MMTLLCSSIYHALSRRGYSCEVTANTTPDSEASTGSIYTLVVDVSDVTSENITESTATLFFTCKDTDKVNEDGLCPLFTLELNSIDLGNTIYIGKRANVEGMSKPVGPMKLEDLAKIINIINECFTIIVTEHDQYPDTKNMWSPEVKINDAGFSLITISIGDYNLVTSSGRVEGYNTYVRLSHMATKAIVITAIDEETLMSGGEFDVLSTTRMEEGPLQESLKYMLDKNHQYLVKDTAKRTRERLIKDVNQVCHDVLLPFAKTAMESRMEINIQGTPAKEKPEEA